MKKYLCCHKMKLEAPRSTKVWSYIVGFKRYQQSKKYSIQQGKKFFLLQDTKW